MNNKRFEAPSHLSERAKALWLQLVPERARSIGRLTLLQSALEALDTADRARAELVGQSLTTKTLGTGTIHVHPLLRVEREARAQFSKLWSDLGLGFSNYQDACDYQVWQQRLTKAAEREQ